jgi:hypothetical protein
MKRALPRPVDSDLIADEVRARSVRHELEGRPLQSLEAEAEYVVRYSNGRFEPNPSRGRPNPRDASRGSVALFRFFQ